MSVRVDLHMTGDSVSIADMVRFGRLAEDAGLGGVWTAEAWRDSLVPLAGVAAATSRIPLGTDVCQWTRTPVTMELAAADLDELSGGRFTLGLGTGPAEWNENWHGIAYERPLVRMREYVEAVRLLSGAHLGAPVTFEGEFFQVRDYARMRGPVARRIPIHIGATRAGMARLSGAIADGINFNVVLSAPYIREVMLPAVEAGARDAGRDPGEVARGLLVSTAVSDDRAQAYRWARHQLAFYAGIAPYFQVVMAHHGFEADYVKVRDAFLAGDAPGAVELVTDAMVDELALAGTPDEVRGKLARYEGIVDFVMLYAPTFMLPPEQVAAEHEAMIAAFASS